MNINKFINGGIDRCVQASFRMIAIAHTGNDPGKEEADRLTGYVEGRGTWQFRMFLSLAEMGLSIVDHENFDFQGFLTDPEKAIFEQVEDPEAVQGILDETDIPAEQAAIRSCIESELISFDQSVPSFSDIEQQIEKNRIVMCNVNLRVLEGRDGREGHMLLIKSLHKDFIVAHDPGSNGGLNKKFARAKFEEAWSSPSPEMANYIAIGN
ncbi:MAG: hypothetical protein AAGC95_16250 [Pseudomonadota bacterium]